MQLDFKTLIGIRNNILGNMQNPLSKIEGTYDYDIAAATALEIKDLYDYLEWCKLWCSYRIIVNTKG